MQSGNLGIASIDGAESGRTKEIGNYIGEKSEFGKKRRLGGSPC